MAKERCKNCNKEFEKKYSYQCHCSRKCCTEYKLERYKKKCLELYGRNRKTYGNGICKFCKDEYIKNDVDQKYCSHICADKDHPYYENEKDINENYFSKIDNPKKAYWLGFIFGDGYIDKDNSFFRLVLAEEDECIIDLLCEELNLPKIYKKYYGPYKSNKQKQVHFTIRNKTIVNDLIKHGCINKKSLKVRFPDIEYKNEFLLGLYDADGTRFTSGITGGSYEMFEDIKRVFNIENRIREKNNNVFCLNIGNKLLRSLFEQLDYGLKRKRVIK